MYSWDGMTKITLIEAIDRFNNNRSVYLLYDDESEGLADTKREIREHAAQGGELGYEKEIDMSKHIYNAEADMLFNAFKHEIKYHLINNNVEEISDKMVEDIANAMTNDDDLSETINQKIECYYMKYKKGR